MCFGSKKSAAPAPAPVAAAPTGPVVADNSNTDQRKAVIAAQTADSSPKSFGSELGSPSAAAPASGY